MPTHASLQKQDLAAETRRAAIVAADAESARQGTRLAAGLGLLVAIIAIAIMVSMRPATITRSDTELSVRAAGFSASVPLAGIDSVRLATSLSGLGAKQNGFQFGSVYAGRFAMQPHGNVRLFVNTSRPPYLTVFAKTGVVIMNGKSAADTQRLFGELSQRVPSAGGR